MKPSADYRLRKSFDLENIGEEPESETLIDDVMRTDERNRILHMCMERINADYREALYLVYFENMRHAEAAAVMGKSEKQVADLIYRGKNSLRRRLEEEGVTDAEY
ncbi:MAG: sigma factor-like helix-turn-helix DNA-binding protein [Eubacteriales bacterium]|nr:sigma factor-like helix-turn-helix DNA-binding protein [Eubacteriales bacterium]